MLNLFDILLENIDCNQLIEEGKDPVEVLHYKFQNVPSDVIDAIIAIDPTKKKSYSQWVLSKWSNEEDIISHAIQNGRLEKLFQFFKEHQEKQIKDCPSVSEGLDAYVPQVEDTVLDKSTEPQTYVLMLGEYVDSELANDFDIVFNEDNWLIAVPHTFEASCKLGENCWWCTANHFGNGDGYYQQYLRQGGEYYINFDLSQGETLRDRTEKEYPYTRYQFHFESKQFKAATEGEPDVSLEDLNIPQSAIDFYHEIDEDYDIGEKSDEQRYEEYTDARYGDNIWLTDNLYLNVEFNDNWEYEEPDLDRDSWYVFDYEDDRDPLSWDEVDPHLDTSLVHKSSNEDVFIIKRSGFDDCFLTLLKGVDRWRGWQAFAIYQYQFIEGYDNTFFAIGEAGYRTKGSRVLIFARGDEGKQELEFANEHVSEDNTEMFLNNNFGNYSDHAYGFLEIILPDGYHSLVYASDDSLEYIIQKDVPINGKYFELSEGNTIQGEFRSYNIDEYWNGQRDEYHLVEELPNGDYLVKQDNTTEDIYGMRESQQSFNILSRETRELLLGFWAKAIEPTEGGYKVMNKSQKVMYVDFNGKPVFNGEYDKVVPLVKDAKILCGIQGSTNRMESCDLIDETTGDVFARIKEIDLTHQPQNNKIVVVVNTDNGDTSIRVYDYIKRQFDYDQYIDIKYTKGHNLIGLLEDGTYQIFDYLSRQVVIDGIVEVVDRLRYYDVSLKDNTHNRMYKSGTIISPINYNNLNEDNGYICGVERNGKYYFFDYEYSGGGHKCLFRKDGLDMQGYIHMYGTINFPLDSGYVVGYSYSKDKYLYAKGGYNYPLGYNSPQVDENAPQDVIDMVNYLQGNTNQPITQETPSQDEAMAMAEQFRHMLKRIDEARRLNYRDMV